MANIFQQYLQPARSVMDYQADYDKADARKQELAQNALSLATGRQKFDEGVQSTQRAAQLRAALTGLAAGATDDDRIKAMRGTGSPEGFAAADALDKSLIDRRKGGAAAGKDEAETAKANQARNIALHEFHSQKLATVQTPEDALAWAQEGQQLGVFAQPGQYERGVAGIQQAAADPQTFAQWKQRAMQGGQSVTEQLKQQLELAKQVEQTRQFGVTDRRIQTEGAAGRAVTMRGQNMADSRAKESNDGADLGLSPGAIANAAGRYNLDGTLPPMGMGKTGAAGRKAILNQAAALKDGVDPEQQRRDQLNNKGDAAARNASVRDFSSAGKSGQAIQATNTGLNHLETIEQLALAQKNGNTRLWNTMANKIASETGLAAPTNLQAAITMVAPEVSKAVIGAAGGQEERATFAKNFNPNGSPEQTLEGIGTIKELMGGRLTEAQRTYERTVGKKDFRDTMLSPAAQRVLDRTHKPAGAAPAAKDIHAAADAILNGHK